MTRRQAANAIRALSMDAVQKANSGHPGAPMGMADIAEVLFTDFLNHNPSNPQWINRDRFVLSNGHGSMLIYALLHLTGYDVSMDDIKQFRQWESKTPGHPEYGYTPGVETTTGPLGQGLANAVGMALAEKHLAATFNKEQAVIDHFTYVFVGDGCLMEGISHEVCSLAGTLGLGKLIAVYDDNGISIDGDVKGWFTDNTAQRFESYGWQVITDVDGHDAESVSTAIGQAKQNQEKPSLVICRTSIGYGSPNKANSAKAHGSPLGEDEIIATKKSLDWSWGAFEIPTDIYQHFDCRETGRQKEQQWNQLFAEYQRQYPELASELQRRMTGKLPESFNTSVNELINTINKDQVSVASRQASLLCLQSLTQSVPELFGGSADLTGSNLTQTKDSQAISNSNPAGQYVNYGVREFGMSAMMNGMLLHGGLRPFVGTFLVFMEYARNAVRMSALMGIPGIFVYTHDSIGLGEDGPTHQPIEQLANLRTTPNLSVWRPADAVETAVAWKTAVERQNGPTTLVLSRQKLPHQARSEKQLADVAKGGYILEDSEQEPTAIVIATGSELAISREAVVSLNAEGHQVRLVSMPSVDTFLAQSVDYQQTVLPSHIRKRVAVEAAVSDTWYRIVGLDGMVIGLDRFGESAPGPVLMEKFGFTAENIKNTTARLSAS